MRSSAVPRTASVGSRSEDAHEQRVAELAIEAGVPEGVFNLVHGNASVGAALSSHEDVDLVTFTGSSATGRKLLIAAGQSNMKRLVLECGGKSPNIVFDDAPNLDAVADRVAARAFWNQGQVCTASSRLLVHERIKDELIDLVIRKTSALRFGDPLLSETKFGALVSREHQQKVLSYVSQADRRPRRLHEPNGCSGLRLSRLRWTIDQE